MIYLIQIFNYTIQIYKFQQVLHIQAKDQVKGTFSVKNWMIQTLHFFG